MKILFIEDEAHLQEILSRVLREAGFEIVQAYDGERGFQLARDAKPNLILLDLILPKKDGFSVLKDLKEDDMTKNIPVMVLTNLEQNKDVERVLAMGAASYLVKTSYEPKDIVEKIKKILKIS